MYKKILLIQYVSSIIENEVIKLNRQDKYYTVSEFSKIAGVSKQYLYSELENRLKDYYMVIRNKKMIDKKALIDVFGIEENTESNNQEECKVESQENQEESITFNQQMFDVLMKQIDGLNAQIEILNNQLMIKDKQLESLNQRWKDSQTILEKSLKNTNQAHFLHMADKRIDVLESDEVKEQPESKKRNWWSRLIKGV